MILQKNITKLFFLLLLLLSIGLIFYKFPYLPRNLSFDEVEFAKLALSLENTSYIPYSKLATGHSTLYFYILLVSLKTFGVTQFALRLPAAIFGVASVLLFYVLLGYIFTHFKIVKTLETKTIALFSFLLASVLLTSHWYLNFARYSFEATFLLMLELISILFFFHYVQDKKRVFVVLSSIFAGLAYLSYTPGRLFFIIPLLFLFIETGVSIRNKFQNILTFIIPFILIIFPLSLYLFFNPDIRVNQLSFFHNNQLSVNQKLTYFGENIYKTAGMFHLKGDLNGRQNYPGKPALNPILGILMLGGLVSLIRHRSNRINIFFVIYFLLSLLPTLLTYPQENPHMLRTFTALPGTVYFIGLGIALLNNKLSKRLFWIVVVLLVIVSSLYELRTYFSYQSEVFKQAFEMKGDLRKLINMPKK